MRVLTALVKWIVIALVVVVAAIGTWLFASPPALIRVGAGYVAKIVCSNTFIAGRDPQQVLGLDVQAPGDATLKFFDIKVDEDKQTVRAALLGYFGATYAVRRTGFGCTTVPDGEVDAAQQNIVTPPDYMQPNEDALWPKGEQVGEQRTDVAALLDDPKLTGPGMRAVVVVRNGRIIAEAYGDGFGPETKLLGWSMTKTVNAAIIGTLVGAGKLTLDQKNLFEEWNGDGRANITLADLLAMSSGLHFNEDYGDVSDVTRMLYLEPDMAAFAAGMPLDHDPGSVFAYSSGTAVMLARIWQDALGGGEEALHWPQEALFGPVGMTSAVFETDESGTFVGSSYLYATAHDWARFGQLLLDNGTWDGVQILPADYARMMHEEAPASDGTYGKGQVWLVGPPGEQKPEEDYAAGMPDDAYWLQGHDGQTVAIVPSRNLVVVRLGLTPSNLGYRPQHLVAAVVKAVTAPE